MADQAEDAAAAAAAVPADDDDVARLECRFFENQFPAIDEVVMVNVDKVADVGAYVTLLEYAGLNGMILRSEFSRRRIRSVNKLIRVGRNEVVMVLRVDTEKGYIDLSKRRVSPEDVAKCEDRYNKAKSVHSVLRHVADVCGLRLLDLYERVAWPLRRQHGNAYDAFKLMLSMEHLEGHADVLQDLDIPANVKEQLLTHIRRRLAPQPVKIRSDIEVCCFSEEGIDAIKRALVAGLGASTDEVAIKIRLIAPPMYVMSTTTLDRERGIAALSASIEVIRTSIEAAGGRLEVKMEPKVVTQREETELQAMLDRVQSENTEVDGDDDDEAEA